MTRLSNAGQTWPRRATSGVGLRQQYQSRFLEGDAKAEKAQKTRSRLTPVGDVLPVDWNAHITDVSVLTAGDGPPERDTRFIASPLSHLVWTPGETVNFLTVPQGEDAMGIVILGLNNEVLAQDDSGRFPWEPAHVGVRRIDRNDSALIVLVPVLDRCSKDMLRSFDGLMHEYEADGAARMDDALVILSHRFGDVRAQTAGKRWRADLLKLIIRDADRKIRKGCRLAQWRMPGVELAGSEIMKQAEGCPLTKTSVEAIVQEFRGLDNRFEFDEFRSNCFENHSTLPA